VCAGLVLSSYTHVFLFFSTVVDLRMELGRLHLHNLPTVIPRRSPNWRSMGRRTGGMDEFVSVERLNNDQL